MKFKKNIRNLSKDIEDIGNLVKKIENNSHISQLEKDILRAKIHKFYESFLNLDVNSNSGNLINIEEEDPQLNKFDSKQGDEVGMEKNIFVEQEPKFENEIEISNESEVDNIELEPEPEIYQNPETVQTEPSFNKEETEKTSVVELTEDDKNASIKTDPGNIRKKPGSEVVSDMYKNKKQFRNESIQKGNTQDISSKFHSQPISDISVAIGINDKFRYIRELFDGDNVQYAETLRFLNNVKSETEAENYLKDKFEWDMEMKLVRSLLDLTSRKLKMTNNG